MKLVTGYNTVTLVSGLTMDNLQRAAKFCPDALVIKKDKEPVFRVMPGRIGSVDSIGVVFADKDNEGHCFVAMAADTMPSEPEKLKAELKDDFGLIMVNLGIVEAQVTTALTGLADTLSTIDSVIQVQQ